MLSKSEITTSHNNSSHYLIRIATGFDLVETLAVRSYLQAYGVPVQMSNEYFMQACLSYTVAVDGMELWVPKNFAIQAGELLAERQIMPPARLCSKKIIYLLMLFSIFGFSIFFLHNLSLPARGFFTTNLTTIRKLIKDEKE